MEGNIHLKLRLKGSCNLNLIERISINKVPGFNIYQHSTNYFYEVFDGNYYNEKEFEIIFVPVKAGVHQIPAIEIDYFDTEKEEYSTLRIPSTEVEVMASDKDNNLVEMDNQEEEDLSYQEKDEILIRQVFDSKNNYDDYYNLKKSTVHNIISGFIIFVLLTLAFIYLIKTVKNLRNKDQIKDLYKKIKKTSDIEELYNLFNELVNLKYKISIKASSNEKIQKRIKDENLVKVIMEIVDYYENENERTTKELKSKILKIKRL